MNRKIIIYCLINPLTDEPFYVGATQNLKVRISCHCANSLFAPNRNSVAGKRKALIDTFKKKGLLPGHKVLKVTTEKNMGKWEQYYYNKFTKEGYSLIQSKGHFVKKDWFRYVQATHPLWNQ